MTSKNVTITAGVVRPAGTEALSAGPRPAPLSATGKPGGGHGPRPAPQPSGPKPKG